MSVPYRDWEPAKQAYELWRERTSSYAPFWEQLAEIQKDLWREIVHIAKEN